MAATAYLLRIELLSLRRTKSYQCRREGGGGELLRVEWNSRDRGTQQDAVGSETEEMARVTMPPHGRLPGYRPVRQTVYGGNRPQLG